MSIITVGSTASLVAALGKAHAGDTIQLQAGQYDGLVIQNLTFSQDVTITSADPLHKAVLTNFNVSNVTGLKVANVELFANGPAGYYDFNVRNSNGVHFDHVSVHGSLDNNPANDANGILFQNSNNVSVTNSEFQQLGHGAAVLNASKVDLSGNTVHDLRIDGFDFGQVDHVTVNRNNFTDFRAQAGDHPDAIQFWTTNTTTASHDIVVSNNVVTQGDGSGGQGIFFRDGIGTLAFQNVTISNNLVEGGYYNGIRVIHADGVTVSNNVLTTNVDGLPIRLELDQTTNSSATNNQAISFIFTDNTGLTQSGNMLNNVMSDNGNAVLSNWLHQQGEDSLYASLKAAVSQAAITALGAPTLAAVTSAADQLYTDVETMGPTATSLTVGSSAVAIGNDLNDSITGGWGANQIFGFGGNDTINGNGGSDTLVGGSGDDTYIVPNMLATIVETAGGGNDTVIAMGNYVLPSNVENLVINSTVKNSWSGTGNELNNVITGNGGSNKIDGAAGNDSLDGGAANDTLIGGEGDDHLTGGVGVDVFRFGPHCGHDVITDFGLGGEKDVIDISAFKAAGLTAALQNVGADLVISFSSGDAITVTGVHANQLIATSTGWHF